MTVTSKEQLKDDLRYLRQVIKGTRGVYTAFRIGQCHPYDSRIFFAAELAEGVDDLDKIPIDIRLYRYKSSKRIFSTNRFA
ncbi:hypothetical protein ACTNIH_004457 [Vibrio parahaemolyticus]|uniref:hypothetical protein n=1 Tax=Vibrio harveyi group TaxID=717610 RepID=UPI0005B71326|nr:MULTISPECIES: hypothetical protein [Vibrio harveyi group]KIT53249.1 hypothetical protein H334_23760 [Vibrio parahaemolyticus 901128]EGQ8484482.1 hypothetical protein [Vibrio parahaemolyticus]EGQ9704945.1 hypothetical protein [Vibrio parahaemolyticus]EGR1688751.1 hypothetical protein [Vibrio parahaemolyticus]EGR1756784.1 hypothetical protein [Vibrio parahaemolyticus]